MLRNHAELPPTPPPPPRQYLQSSKFNSKGVIIKPYCLKSSKKFR